VVNIYRETYKCPECARSEEHPDDQTFVKAPVQEPLIPESYASESVVAWAMHQKYQNGLPLKRQEADWKQLGVPLSRATLANWIIYCAGNYPDAEKIVLVMDNLNTHKPSSLYKRYPAEEARRILKRLEFHYTPKHGSWLDIAEIELHIMTRQCLSRRIAEIGLLRSELSAWETERNTLAAKVNWHFRTSDARIKLSSLYPAFTTAS